MPREILLTRGFVALIDDDDLALVSRLKWSAQVSRAGLAYAASRERQTQRFVLMHRLLMSAPAGAVVDHVNGVTTDNRRENLRVCTTKENSRNRIGRRGHEHKGVHFQAGKWAARITVNGEYLYLGRFVHVEDAQAAYDAAALSYFGAFSRLNLPTKHSHGA